MHKLENCIFESAGDGCKGVFGEYLKYNNPHKASLYLASGIPIIVWKESALAEFVEEHKCGISVYALNKLKEQLSSIDIKDYQKIVSFTNKVAGNIVSGKFTEASVSRVGDV
jgi:hypothetical protein